MSSQLSTNPDDSSAVIPVEMFCARCGTKNQVSNAFCLACGNSMRALTRSEATLMPRSNLQTRMAEPHQFNYLEAIVFPFKQRNWIGKLWWLPLVTFIPPFSFILMRGWRLDLVRRIGRRNPDSLPGLSDIARFFAEGILLYVMTALYLIPLGIFTVIAGASWIQTILEIGWWILQIIFDRNNAIPVGAFITQLGLGAILQLASPFVYLVLTYPFYRMSMVRYALGKNALVFFDIVGNAREIWKHPIMLTSLWFLEVLTATLFGLINGIVISTLVGVAIMPFVLALLFPMQYSITGYLFGSLAERVNPMPVNV